MPTRGSANRSPVLGGLEPDVTAEPRALEADPLRGRVRRHARLGDRRTGGGHVEDAAAVGDELLSAERGRGMEDDSPGAARRPRCLRSASPSLRRPGSRGRRSRATTAASSRVFSAAEPRSPAAAAARVPSRSPSRRGRIAWVSGSPKRQLNSSTRGPVLGDSMVAGMVWSMCEGKTLEEMAMMGVACGTAAQLNEGTRIQKRRC